MTGPQTNIIIPTEAFPLTWPSSVKRTKTPLSSRFVGCTIGAAIEEIRVELRRLGATNVVISSNLPLRRDGEPRASGLGAGQDQGVAVYWVLHRDAGKEITPEGDTVYKSMQKVPYCLPCDKWKTLAENLHAIALTIEALRAVERYGAVHVVQAFEGFKALPPGESSTALSMAPPWREVLGGNWPTQPNGEPLPNGELLGVVRGRYRSLVAMVHPNNPAAASDPNAAARVTELTQARDAAEEELKA